MSYTRQAFKYNNTELIYTHSIYVSPEGNDSSGEGTREKPYKTIQFATSKLFNDTTVIVLLPGIYNENPYQNTTFTNLDPYSGYHVSDGAYNSNGYDYLRGANVSMNKGLFTSFDYKTNFIGYPNETIVNVEFNEPYCSIVLTGVKKEINMYGITINVTCNQSMKDVYDSNCFITTYYNTQSCYIYNCNFKYINNFENERGIFHATAQKNIKKCYMYNCVIDMGDIYNAFAGNGHSKFRQCTWNGWYYRWDDSGVVYDPSDNWQTARLVTTNCIFLNIQDWSSIRSTTLGPYIEMVNCIYPNIDKLYRVSTTNCFKDDMKLDNDYYPLQSELWKYSGRMDLKNPDNTISNIGLYGGIYAWVKTLSNKAEITMKNFDIVLQRGDDAEYDFEINAPISYGIININRNVENNFVQNGVEYKYALNKKEWNKLNRIEFL